MSKQLTGVLLVNLGTPAQPTMTAVRHYLKEFLSDPYVIDLPDYLRWPLLHLLILPLRSVQSAQRYQKIWRPEGSPLLLHSQALTHAVAQQLGEKFHVQLAMRYGQPSLNTALSLFVKTHCRHVMVVPLFPQFSYATTQGIMNEIQSIMTRNKYAFTMTTQKVFFNERSYIHSFGQLIKNYLPSGKRAHVIFSYHGVPYDHLKKTGCPMLCESDKECPSRYTNVCYRAQCFETSRLLAHELHLPKQEYSVTFQSRLGKANWTHPYTNEHLVALSNRDVAHLVIACPSFVVDCLETLEEIGIRAKTQWMTLGGESFKLVPALNIYPTWVKGLSDIIRHCETSNNHDTNN